MDQATIKVALVGRPNVGKSALFNRMCGERIAIVDEMEGVTRDRLSAETEYFGVHFELIDTAGIDPQGEGAFNREVIEQSKLAIEEADAIIIVVDATVGLTPLDRIVAQIVRQSGKPHILALNKCDDEALHLEYEFHSLDIDCMLPVSAIHGKGIEDVFEALVPSARSIEEIKSQKGIQIAIVGRPNVGKSTLINAILGENRVIVSDIAGTTRDSIDTPFQQGDHHYTLIDTAGVRRKHKEHEVVDKFASIRTQRAIERSDLCLFVIDVCEGLTTYEKRILTEIEKAGKGCILFLNKWDKAKGFRMEHAQKALIQEAPFVKYCPMIIGSALQKRNIDKIFIEVHNVYKQLQRRITTADLNHFLERSMQLNHPPMIMGKRLRVYYMTQVKTPAQFVLFVNYKDRMATSYERYLMNEFRKHYGFVGVPVRFYLKKKSQKDLQFAKKH